MKVQLSLTCLLFVISTSLAQNTRACKKILEKEVSTKLVKENTDAFLKDFQTLIYCEFDSIDCQVLLGPQNKMVLISQLLTSLPEKPSDNDIYTYKYLRDLLIELKQTEAYLNAKKMIEAHNEFVKKEALLRNWDIDKQILVQIGLMEYQLKDIYTLIEKNEHKKYSEIFRLYSDTFIEKKLN